MRYYSALQIVAASTVFTTHTPVPAGNDAFSRQMMERYFSKYALELGISFEDFFRLGQPTINAQDSFSMTILALKSSRHANGVSQLHGQVSQGLWSEVWPGAPVTEVPITSITNGVHAKTWIAPELQRIYGQYFGVEWERQLTDRHTGCASSTFRTKFSGKRTSCSNSD